MMYFSVNWPYLETDSDPRALRLPFILGWKDIFLYKEDMKN